MRTHIPQGFRKEALRMKALNFQLLSYLSKKYRIEKYPKIPVKKELDGEGYAFAYPMQGILKYHGMPDWKYRTAFFPSVSVCNDAAKAVTCVRFDSRFRQDTAIVNGKEVSGHELQRITQTLDFIRRITGARSRAFVYSKNIAKAAKTGKGLGTSAAASAALALAAVQAALGEEYSSNNRFLTSCARFLSGSGCRSAAGGVALWLSFPGIKHEDSFAVRLDSKNQFSSLSLITVPVNSRTGLKTEAAHEHAPRSPLFRAWMGLREKHVWEILKAVEGRDWEKIGQIAELDTMLLHGVTMSSGPKLIGWEPETIQLMRAASTLRESGTPVYYSVDTGPTTVYITHEKYSREIVSHIKSLGFDDVVAGKIGGPAERLQKHEAEKECGTSFDEVLACLK